MIILKFSQNLRLLQAKLCDYTLSPVVSSPRPLPYAILIHPLAPDSDLNGIFYWIFRDQNEVASATGTG
jgi:hypothetical protein